MSSGSSADESTRETGNQRRMREFDVVVIGSGSAGTSAATALRAHGRSVAVVDQRPFGGTCVLRGCDPKKVLVAAARVIDDAQRYAALGILDSVPLLQWDALMHFKHTFTDPMPAQRVRELEEAGAVALHGSACFEDPQTLRIDDELVRAGNVVIASGAAPRHVATGDEALVDSEQFLDLEHLPVSLIFVGGGYIAFEFANLAARAGAKATILHRGAQPLEGFDADAVAFLLRLTREAGIEVQLEATVESVERAANGVIVHARVAGQLREFRAEAGVLAAGRVADLDALALEAGNVERSAHGVKVNAHLQSTSNPCVYAAGDAADGGGLPLTPVAGYEGEIVAKNILDGNTHTLDWSGLASMVYSMPALGVVGLSEEQARERNLDIDVRSGDMTSWYGTRHVAGRGAFYKMILEKGTRAILGAAILGPHAEEQINVLAAAIRSGVNADALVSTLFAYPTGSSDLEYMLA